MCVCVCVCVCACVFVHVYINVQMQQLWTLCLIIQSLNKAMLDIPVSGEPYESSCNVEVRERNGREKEQNK